MGNMGTVVVMCKAFPVCLALTKQICVLVFLGCFNKMPRNGWLRTSRNVFLTGLETETSKIKEATDSMPGKCWPPGSQMAIFSLCPHMAEGARKFSESL